MNIQDVIYKHFGSFYEDEDLPWVVSFWNIPGGSDYHRATPVKAFFPSQGSAKRASKEINEICRDAMAVASSKVLAKHGS